MILVELFKFIIEHNSHKDSVWIYLGPGLVVLVVFFGTTAYWEIKDKRARRNCAEVPPLTTEPK